MFSFKIVFKDRFIISILITIVLLVLVIFGFIFNNNGNFFPSYFVYIDSSSDPNQINYNITNSLNIQNIATKIVQVGDISIAYKIFGNDKPILLISMLL
jgi:hypothetical protein